jgi:DNA-binding NarL/FixJ family response regulator
MAHGAATGTLGGERKVIWKVDMRACEDDAGETTRVLLVEDHALFRQALSLLLYRHPHMEVMQAGTLAEARPLLGGVDVVALDDFLPDGSGIELIGDVRASNPGASVLVLSNDSDAADPESALEAGADTVVSKVESPFTIVDEIKLLGGAGPAPRSRRSS